MTKKIHFFLFDTNAIDKKTLDSLAKKHLHSNEIITLHQRKIIQAQHEFIISRLLIKQLFINGTKKTLNQIEIRFNKESLLLEVFYLDKLQLLSISLSHSKGVIFLAITKANISLGVDIEHVSPKRDVSLLSKNFFHPIEVEQIKQGGALAFYRIWTLKEAISKHLKQSIIKTLKQNIFEQLLLVNYQSTVYKEFDLSFVSKRYSPINNSINLCNPQDFLKLFTDNSPTDLTATNEEI